MLFAKMGVPNDQLAFFTTLLYFPWFLKGLWGPFVDIIRTKRWWIVTMQALMTALCILLTLSHFSRFIPLDISLFHHRRFCVGDP